MEGSSSTFVATSKMDKQSFKVNWTIDGFDVLKDFQEAIHAASTKVTVRIPALSCDTTWSIYLHLSDVDGVQWIGVFYKLVSTNPVKDVENRIFTTLRVLIRNTGGRSGSFFHIYSDNFNATKLGGGGWGFQEVIKADTPSAELPLTNNGSLKIVVEVTICAKVVEPAVVGFHPWKIPEMKKKLEGKVLQDFSRLLEAEAKGDVKIVSMEGTVFPANKAILTARSRKFAELFLTDKTDRIEMTEMSSKTVQKVLQYAFTGRVSSDQMTTLEELVGVVHAACKYDLKDLHQYCGKVLGAKAHLWNISDARVVATAYRLLPVPALDDKKRDRIEFEARSGMNQQAFRVDWTIEGFDVMQDVKYLINNKEMITVTMPKSADNDSCETTWLMFLECKKEGDIPWLGVFHKLVSTSAPPSTTNLIYSKLKVEIKNKDGEGDFFNQSTKLKKMDMASNGWGFLKVINASTPLAELPVRNGSLEIHLEVNYWYTKIPTPSVELESCQISNLEEQIAEKALEDFRHIEFLKDHFDVELISKEGTKFLTNKYILSVRSPVFETMLMKTDMVEKVSQVVKIDDISEETLPFILDYVYTGNITLGYLRTLEGLESVVYVADKYGMEDLRQYCDVVLAETPGLLHTCGALEVAIKFRLITAESKLKRLGK